MSVSTTISSVSYAGNASTSAAYPTTFPFFDAADLSVVVNAVGVPTTLALGSGYSVTGGAGSTGSITTTSAVPSTSTVIITRSTAKTQLTSYTTGDRFPASAQEKALDKLTMLVQEATANNVPSSASAAGTAPYVLGLSAVGGTPTWTPQTAAAIADGAITSAKIAAAAVTPAKLSANGNITWDASGNITAPSFTGSVNGNATTATTASGVVANSVTPAGLAGSVGANAWVSKTANYTASTGDRIEADTTSSSFTITLPASPVLGSMVTIADSGRTWATNNLMVSRNASTIEGLSEDLVCNVSGKRIAVIYNGSTWRIY
jgi:hypothetical protein